MTEAQDSIRARLEEAARAFDELDKWGAIKIRSGANAAALMREAIQELTAERTAREAAERRVEQLETHRSLVAGVLDAKYLNPECCESGCQWLKLEAKLESDKTWLRAQRDVAEEKLTELSARLTAAEALIARWESEAAYEESFHATMGIGWKSCARELRAALSPKPEAE